MERITIADLIDPSKDEKEDSNANKEELPRTEAKEAPGGRGEKLSHLFGAQEVLPPLNGRWPVNTWFQKRRREVALRNLVDYKSNAAAIKELGRLSGDWRIK